MPCVHWIARGALGAAGDVDTMGRAGATGETARRADHHVPSSTVQLLTRLGVNLPRGLVTYAAETTPLVSLGIVLLVWLHFLLAVTRVVIH